MVLRTGTRCSSASMSDDATLAPCPECAETYTYEQGALLVCPMCGHEWMAASAAGEESAKADNALRDAAGYMLADGDTVTNVKGLKVSGGGSCCHCTCQAPTA